MVDLEITKSNLLSGGEMDWIVQAANEDGQNAKKMGSAFQGGVGTSGGLCRKVGVRKLSTSS